MGVAKVPGIGGGVRTAVEEGNSKRHATISAGSAEGSRSCFIDVNAESSCVYTNSAKVGVNGNKRDGVGSRIGVDMNRIGGGIVVAITKIPKMASTIDGAVGEIDRQWAAS